MAKNIRCELKILVIGSSGTGKTSFVQRWTKGNFIENYKPTVVSDFGFKIIEYKEKKYRIQLWDIGGQDKSPFMAKIFSHDSHGCLVLSDCSKPETLKQTLDWKNVMSEESSFVDGKKLPFVLVQNKIDLIQSKEELDEVEENTKDLANNNDFVKYFMTSVKENVNIEETMLFIIGNIIDRMEDYAAKGGDIFPDERRKYTVSLNDPSFNIKDKKESCC
jgi:small GTP-binding protein